MSGTIGLRGVQCMHAGARSIIICAQSAAATAGQNCLSLKGCWGRKTQLLYSYCQIKRYKSSCQEENLKSSADIQIGIIGYPHAMSLGFQAAGFTVLPIAVTGYGKPRSTGYWRDGFRYSVFEWTDPGQTGYCAGHCHAPGFAARKTKQCARRVSLP